MVGKSDDERCCPSGRRADNISVTNFRNAGCFRAEKTDNAWDSCHTSGHDSGESHRKSPERMHESRPARSDRAYDRSNEMYLPSCRDSCFCHGDRYDIDGLVERNRGFLEMSVRNKYCQFDAAGKRIKKLDEHRNLNAPVHLRDSTGETEKDAHGERQATDRWRRVRVSAATEEGS